MTRVRSAGALLLAVLLCLTVGAAGSLVTATSVTTWYPLLEKPPWTPPAWLFGPAWTLFYLMMAFAVWRVWREAEWRHRGLAIAIFAVQLMLNTLWSLIFFGLRSPGWALLEIGLLWITILATIFVFAQLSRWAAALLVPYLLWVSFAAALNLAIWRLNP